jgi:Zn finger protein HypA/HybF involved in hydrogenase expression
MTTTIESPDASAWKPTFARVDAWCDRCHRTIPLMYHFRRCDSCLDREINMLKKSARQNNSFVEGGYS